MDIRNLAQASECLIAAGYKTSLGEYSLEVMVGKLPAHITHDGDHFNIICPLGKLGDIPDGQEVEFLIAALSANNAISPYAFCLDTTEGEAALENADYPFFLKDTIPVGDLSGEELKSSIQSLRSALITTSRMLAAVTQPIPAGAA